MLFWLIALVLLALLSPLLWLLPKAGQNERMQLRLAARRMGMTMQLSSQNWPYWMAHIPNPCAQYQLPCKQSAVECCYWQSAPGQWQNQWREPCTDNALLSLLQQLPIDAYKIETDNEKVAIYWGECGGLDSLKKIASVLKALTAAKD